MRSRLARERWLVAVLAGAVAALGVAVGVATPAVAAIQPSAVSCDRSGQSGGQVAQATVLARAQVWVDRNIPYTQTCTNTDPGGNYREDCSGFIAMVWELTNSPITTQFNPKYNGGDSRFRQISPLALVPGDALVRDATGDAGDKAEHHIVLFVGWGSADDGQHRYANIQEESTFNVGTIAKSNQDLTTTFAGFTPIHYVNMASRVGVVTTDAQALVKERDLSASWVTENGGVTQVVVDGGRIGIITTAGSAYVKEGGLSTTWVHEADSVAQLDLSHNRVGILTTAGAAYVKEGPLTATWVHELDNALQIAVSGDRVGVINSANQA
ncbi:MAG: hypothetical protein J2P17_32800, partial [Mycobacterium sp.]|nr:hypothetical protein [Mycobacterium sp.]